MQKIVRVILVVVCSAIAAMWIYAFGFASRESFNKIGDDAWKARSEAHCQVAENERFALEDLTQMNPEDVNALKKNAPVIGVPSSQRPRLRAYLLANELESSRAKTI